jgi:GTPase SAR1 family protein
VLLGDSSVGKSGLALVLSGDAFRPTESTHGRHIWTFDRGTVFLQGGQIQTYETLLWDLAGQPGYRLIHQLHLSEVAVALVVFDARSETDPFSGVRHWDRALRAAQRVQGG